MRDHAASRTPHASCSSSSSSASASSQTTRREEAAPVATSGGSLTFEAVDFTYPTRPGAPVLKGLTLTVAPGEVVGLVGGGRVVRVLEGVHEARLLRAVSLAQCRSRGLAGSSPSQQLPRNQHQQPSGGRGEVNHQLMAFAIMGMKS